MPDSVTPIRKLPPPAPHKRGAETKPIRITIRHSQAIEPFREDRGMGKAGALEYLLDRAFELTPTYERLWGRLAQMSKVRGLSPVEMLDLLIEVGLEALPAHESAIAERQNRVDPLLEARNAA